MRKNKKIILMTSPKAPDGESPLHYGDFRPPLGLGFLACALRKKGHEVLIVDNYIKENSIPEVLRSFNPDFIGIYVHSASYKMALDLIAKLRLLTDAPVMAGGPHASLMPDSLSEAADFIVAGEGEKAIIDVVEGNVSQKIIKAEPLTLEELEDLSWPDYDDFYRNPYNWRLDIFNLDAKKVFSMNTSRGCPYYCKFCGVVNVSGRAYRCFSAKKIVDEIQRLKKKYNIDGVYLREDNFTANKVRLKEFCRLMIERKIDIIWASESRVDAANKELLVLMYKSGCRGLYIGVESGSQKVLDNMNKGISVKLITAFFGDCKAAGIKTYATFCFGTPGEVEEDRQETERMIARIDPTYVDRFVYIGIPRSKFYDLILESGQYYHKDESGFVYPNGYRELAHRYYGKDDRRFIP